MRTTVNIQLGGHDQPVIMAIRPDEGRAFDVMILRDGVTRFEITLGWDDVSAAKQALILIEALQDMRLRALRRLAGDAAEWAAALPFDEEAVGAAERTERDEAEEDRVAS